MATSPSPSDVSSDCPLLELLFFHKATRAELEHLLLDASKQDFQSLSSRVRFLQLVNARHSIAKEEVIFPALDGCVKNVAQTNLLELKEEGRLFDELMELISSVLKKKKGFSVKEHQEIICSTEAIRTALCQHMSKEEDVVIPLFKKLFSFDEQAALVWQFLCSIPLNFMEKFLPWISASLSAAEHEQMVLCMYSIVPNEDALQQVILSWLKTGSTSIWKKYGRAENMKTIHNPPLMASPSMNERDANTHRRGSKRSANDMQEVIDCSHGRLDKYPINDLLLWHNAIRKELRDFAEATRKLRLSACDFSADISNIRDKLQFITEICAFHSAAEDNIVFPGVSKRANQTVSYASEHQEEELQFSTFQSLLNGFETSEDGCMTEVVSKLVDLADDIVESVQKHFSEEETMVLPLARQHCSFHEQQILLYQSLQMMPLKVLEKVLPWFTSFLNEDEAKYVLYSIQQAAPVNDKALVTLFLRWACKGQSRFSKQKGEFKSYSEDRRSVKMKLFCEGTTTLGHMHLRNGVQESKCSETKLNTTNSSATSSGGSLLVKPIDTIFQFHKAIRRDLVYLDEESGKIPEYGEAFLWEFAGRFKMLWVLYHAHSNAEDEIVFPALEAKEALHNVSHLFTIEHKHDEHIFKDISAVLAELTLLFGKPVKADVKNLLEEPLDYELRDDRKYKDELCAKLQSMCKSMHMTINDHMTREELELWPQFYDHFSLQEQDQIVGRIIGITGAEVLQAMIPWVTEALSLEEQGNLFDTWLHAARNTMFDKWLYTCFPSNPILSSHTVKLQSSNLRQDNMPEPGSTECLKMVADYLARDASNEMHIHAKDASNHISEKADNQVVLCKGHLHKEEKFKLEDVSCPTSQCEHMQEVDNDQKHYYSEGYDCFRKLKEGTNTFKPGWQDIFRMTQEELEAALRKVSRDASLDPQQRAYLMQNLMASRWIVTQQMESETSTSHNNSNEITGRCPSFYDQEKGIYGCEHYERNCKLVAACCGQLFTCRLCHDKDSDHVMDRHATKEMMCMKCLKIQPVAQCCNTPSCNNFMMATYYCNICKFFDCPKRHIYHCPYCNMCRVGKGLGIDYFHCMTCNACMHKSLKSHKCQEKGLESNCPICHDFLFTSKAPVKALSCGHYMHSSCFQAYAATRYTCPICCKSLGDMSVYFGMIDALLAREELPDEYKSRKQDILCKDCEQRGSAPFHWLYHKCERCGSYNTSVL